MGEEALTGRVILVVEDEYILAIDLERELERSGATVIGPVPSLQKALEVLQNAPCIDGAVLDVNVGGELIFPAADALADRGVPFVFTTGYDQAVIPPRYENAPRCEKPVGSVEVTHMLERMLPHGRQ